MCDMSYTHAGMYMLGANSALSQCPHWTRFFAHCRHWDVSVPKSSLTDFGAGLGTNDDRDSDVAVVKFWILILT